MKSRERAVPEYMDLFACTFVRYPIVLGGAGVGVRDKMKKQYVVVTIILSMIMVLVGCGNKNDYSLPENPMEFNMGTFTNPVDSEDSYGTTDSTENSADVEVSVNAEEQTSLFEIWEYEGYVDECAGYTWQEEFFDCDYDGDGKIDRVNRSWNKEKQTAIYKIEFGNGDKLVTPKGWETGFPHFQSGDLDGDGEKEILVTLTYDTSTDPYSFGDMWLFDRDQTSGEYVEVELPLVKAENGGKGFNVDYEKLEDNKIRFTIREAGLSMSEEVDEDYLSNWWADDLTTQVRVVFFAEIIGSDNPVLRCYLEPLHRWGPMLGFNLNYAYGKYEIGYIERDTPDSWE